MAEFFMEYGLFLAKTVTLAAAVVFVIGLAATAARRERGGGHLEIDSLNEHFQSLGDSLRSEILPKKEAKAAAKARKAERKAKSKGEDRPERRVFVIDFEGDIRASGVESLREEVSAVLAVASREDEVLVRLENYGGLVHEHGLAASQLARIRSREIPLTACVDKVAASGGYMMACVANRIVAAPFAVVGSIGVLAQIPNFYRMLDERGVHVEQLKAGQYKRTVTMFGKNTEEDREKMTEELEEIHAHFRELIARYRPGLDLERVATGEHWLGSRAQELGLVDELSTSDDWLMAAAEDAELFQVSWKSRKSLGEKVTSVVEDGASAALRGAWQSLARGRYGAS